MDSIAGAKNKANDLIAMIDDVLSGENKIGVLKEEKKVNETHSMKDNKNEQEEEVLVGKYVMSEIMNALLWHIQLCSQPNVIDQLPEDGNDRSNKKSGQWCFCCCILDFISCFGMRVYEI